MTLFAEALKALGARAATRILAVTGTNGKTTTTALTAALCRAAGLDAVAAGNISPAALSVLMERLDAGESLPECWVLELSSFQLETMTGLNADAATVLNVSDDHLDRHGDMDTYAAIKARIFQGGGVQVLNRQDARVMAMRESQRGVVTFGTDLPFTPDDFGLDPSDGEIWLMLGSRRIVALSALRMAGTHNALNALAALALGEAIGLPLEPMIAGLKAFEGLPHRVERVARRADGVLFYDDSKGTNVGATLAAIEGLGRRVVLIAGGDGKGQDFSPLREPVARHARAVVLIGRDASHIEQALQGSGVPVECMAGMNEAVNRAAELAHPGDAVLLSPACSSLDMFRNYAHRADVFVAAVHQLPGVGLS
jgi:UDP-N-acetylmuramoylalanine--D-glutamate ligase